MKKLTKFLIPIILFAGYTQGFSQANVVISGNFQVCSTSLTQSYQVSCNNAYYNAQSWSVSGGTINGSNTASTVSVTWGSSGGSIQVALLNGFSFVGNKSETVTVVGPPSVSISGPGVICSNATTISLNAMVTNGIGTLSFQWYKNGSFLSGQTNPMLQIAVQNGDSFYCRVSSSFWCAAGQITSNTYVANVTTAITPAPTIQLANPQSYYCDGQQLTFVVSWAGYEGYHDSNTTYEWWGWDGATHDAILAGASSKQLSVHTSQSQALNPGEVINVTIRNFVGCTNVGPSGATFHLSAPTIYGPSVPFVSLNANQSTYCSDSNILLTATPMDGGSNPSFAWYIDAVYQATTTGSNNTYSNSLPSGPHSAYVIMTSNAPCISGSASHTSGTQNFTVQPFPSNTTPVADIQIVNPQSNYCTGDQITFKVAPQLYISGSSTYLWKLSGSTISTGSTATVSVHTDTNIPNAFSPGDQVTVQIGNLLGSNCLYSPTASGNTGAIPISINPIVSVSVGLAVNNTSICSNQNVVLTATPTNGGSSPTYAWYVDNTYQTTTTGSNNTYSPSLPPGQHSAYVIMTSNAPCISGPATHTSGTQSFTVHSFSTGTSPVANIQVVNPQSGYCKGDQITFTVAPQPYITESSTYSWLFEGQQYLYSGNTFTIDVWPSAQAGAFDPTDQISVTVSNLLGENCLFPTNASGSFLGNSIEINDYPDASISPCCYVKLPSVGSQLLTASSGTGYTYKWLKNSAYITPSETNSTFTASEEGTYKVEVTRYGCLNNTGDQVTIVRNVLPVVSVGSDQELTLALGLNTSIAATASDADGSITNTVWTQISGSSVSMSGENTLTLSISGLHQGSFSFQLMVTDDFGESVTSSPVTVTVNSPPNNYNHIIEDIVQVPNVTDPSAVAILDPNQKSESINYFDGLGRGIQSVAYRGSPQQQDIVTPMVYDEVGRESRKYLPFTNGNDGAFKTGILDMNGDYINDAQIFYSDPGNKIAIDNKPYAQSVFEPSPLNRVVEQGAPGDDWQPSTGHTITKFYEVNESQDVLKFTYDAITGSLGLDPNEPGRHYTSGMLYATRTADEEGHVIIEYVDVENHTVCKKVQSGGTPETPEFASTYYVYDDFGNLVVVLPPEGVNKLIEQLDN